MQERSRKKQLFSILEKWENESRQAKQKYNEWVIQSENSFSEIPMNPTLRKILATHREVIRSLTVDEFFEALETSEKIAGLVRRTITPKK